MHIPFDVSFHFDDRLREVANNPDEMRQAVEFLQDQLNSTHDTRERIRLFGLIGVYARILHDLETAQNALQMAVDLSAGIADLRHHFVNRIRLAHVYQWRGDFQTSTSMFDHLIEECETEPELLDYEDVLCQHAGKNKFDQSMYRQASSFFLWALHLRQMNDDSFLIESSQKAFEAAENRVRWNRYYRDDVAYFERAPIFSYILNEFDRLLEDTQFDRIAGIEAMGFVVGAALATRHYKGFVTLRKEHKIPLPRTSAKFKVSTEQERSLSLSLSGVTPGMRVLIVDDVVETGAHLQAAVDLIEERGAVVAGIALMWAAIHTPPPELLRKYPCFVLWQNIRCAASEEGTVLTELAMRSKASWGYDAVFMETCRPELTITRDDIQENEIFILEENGDMVGFYQLKVVDDLTVDLNAFFIAPEFRGKGYGERLWQHAVVTAYTHAFNIMTIESDPNAEAFYTAMGAQKTGERESPVQAGRMLPLMRYVISDSLLSTAAKVVKISHDAQE
jgi:adenine phosphoribosyltransferase